MKRLSHLSLLGAITLLMACSPSGENADQNIFRYNESAGISSLDPAYARNLENMWAVNQIFDGLVELDSAMVIQPLIAESWDISDSGRTYTFHLRDDVYFHDHALFPDSAGRKVTAQDFVYSFNRIMDPEIASPGQWIFAQVDFDSGPGFEALDENTLVIHLRRAFSPFLSILSMQYCNAVPHEIADHFGPDFRSNPVGTGPFKYAFWYENVALVYHRFESYWKMDNDGTPLPYLDAVKIDFVRDMNTEFQGLLKGDYDFMSGIHPAYKDELLTPSGELSGVFSEEIKFQRTPFLKTDYLGILVDPNMELSRNHPLNDKRIRQALNWGLNRVEMARYMRNNAVYPATIGFIPKGLPGFDESSTYGYPYNPEKAKQLLAEAGYEDGNGLQSISLSTTSDYVDLCEYIQHAWAQIGIDVQIDVQPSSTQRENVAQSREIMFRKSWLADYADAENFMGLFYSENFCPGGPNYTHFYSESFDSLFVLAGKTVDPEKRNRLYVKMDSLVMSESPVIPLFYDQVSHFVRKDVQGLSTNPVNMLDLSTVRKGDQTSFGNQ